MSRVKVTARPGGVSVHPPYAEMAPLRTMLRVRLPPGSVTSAGRRLDVTLAAAEFLLEPGTVPGVDFEWDEDARLCVINRARARAVWPVMRRLQERLAVDAGDLARALLSDRRDLETLDAHQLVDVALMTARESVGACIFDEQGTGKTAVVVYAFDVLASRGLVDQLLVVAPKSMVPEWRSDFAKFMGDLYRVEVLVGGRAAGRRLDVGADVLVTNYETAVANEPALTALAKSAGGRLALVVDESHNVKNPDAARSRALARLRNRCERAFVLCGTPAPNAPHDVVHQFDLVDFGATFEGVEIPQDRAQARAVIQSAMAARGIYTRNLKSRVLPDLPGKRFTRVLVPLEVVQREAYEAALAGLIRDLSGADDQTFSRNLASYLARKSALLQICSNPGAVVPGYAETPAKLLALDLLLERIVNQEGEKVVVWSFYRHSLDALCMRYARLGLVRYDGTVTSIEARREAVRRFQEDPDVRIFVGNPAAAGAGLTLHAARMAVFESLSNQTAHFLQSVDRIHRRGQTREVELLALLCDESIETIEFDRLQGKARSQRALLGDDDEEALTRETFLGELLTAQALLGERGKGR